MIIACVPVSLADDQYRAFGYPVKNCPNCGDDIFIGPRCAALIDAGMPYQCMFCIKIDPEYASAPIVALDDS